MAANGSENAFCVFTFHYRVDVCRITNMQIYSTCKVCNKNLECCSINPSTPNDHYRGRTAPLTSKDFILYIYSTNIGTEYFKHGIHSPFLSLQNAVCFIILMYLVPVLFTFYIQDVLKLKKNNSSAKRLNNKIHKLLSQVYCL